MKTIWNIIKKLWGAQATLSKEVLEAQAALIAAQGVFAALGSLPEELRRAWADGRLDTPEITRITGRLDDLVTSGSSSVSEVWDVVEAVKNALGVRGQPA